MPTSWHEEVIIPLHLKGANYRGISLLNTIYKTFSKILLKRLMPYLDENGFFFFDEKGESRRLLSIIRQTIEIKYAYRQNILQLFIDF